MLSRREDAKGLVIKNEIYGIVVQENKASMPLVTHDTGQYANNRAEVSHQPTRHRERQMRSRRTPIPTGLDENINHIAVLIHGTPKVLALTVDGDEDFIEIPCVSETPLTTLQSAGVLCSELDRTLPDRFISHVHTPLGEQILDIPKAEAESVIKPDSMADDRRRKTMPKVSGSTSFHPGILQRGELT